MNRLKKARRQARNFVIDVTAAEQLSDEMIEEQLKKIFEDRETQFVDKLILVQGDRIVKILKRT